MPDSAVAEPTPTSPPPPDTTALPSAMDALAGQSAPPPPAIPPAAPVTPQAPPHEDSDHASFLHRILNAVGEAIAPSTQQRVNPQTGAIEKVPVNTAQRVTGAVGRALVGAAAGAAQRGPGATGRAALAGVQAEQEQQAVQKQNLLAQSQNVRQTNEAAQQQLLTKATLAKASQEQARAAIQMQEEGMKLTAAQTELANELMKIQNRPGVKELTSFSTNPEINKHLEDVGPQIAKQYAVDMANADIQVVQGPDGKAHVFQVPKGELEKPVGPGYNLLRAVPDPKTGKLTSEIHPADPNMPLGQAQAFNLSSRTAIDAAQEQQTKIAEQKAQTSEAQAGATKNTIEAQVAAQNAGLPIPGQKAGAAGVPTQSTPVAVQAANGQTIREDTAFLESLAPQRKQLLNEIGTGKMVPEKLSYLLGRPDGQVLAAQLARAYPDWDSSKAQAYPNVYKEFTSTKSNTAGYAMNAGATAMLHLRELHDLNTNASHIPGTQAYRKYQTAINTLAPELAKFYGDTTIPAIEGYKKQFDTTVPGNRNAAIREQAKLMGNKFDQFDQQWKNAAPSPAYEAPLPGISTEAKNARAALDPDYATRIAPPTPPAGATNEVFAPDGHTVTGHIVNGSYVPLGQ